MKPSMMSSLIRPLACIIWFGAIGLATDAVAQTSDTSLQPRFLGLGEDTGHFQPARQEPFQLIRERKRCDTIGFNLRFCPGGTEWTLERNTIVREKEFYQNLYYLSETQRSAFTVIFMPEAESFRLSDAELNDLMMEHVFENGPRGPMSIETVINDMTPIRGNQIIRRTAIVTDQNGGRHLLTVMPSPVRYGVGFLETTVLLPDGMDEDGLSDEVSSFYDDTMKLAWIIAG